MDDSQDGHWFCSHCGNGPMSLRFDISCSDPSCGRRRDEFAKSEHRRPKPFGFWRRNDSFSNRLTPYPMIDPPTAIPIYEVDSKSTKALQHLSNAKDAALYLRYWDTLGDVCRHHYQRPFKHFNLEPLEKSKTDVD